MKKSYLEREKGFAPPRFTLRDLIEYLYPRVTERSLGDFWQEAFGYYCEHQGRVLGTTRFSGDLYLYRKTGVRDLWPADWHRWQRLDEPTIFTLIEELHDLMSEPAFREEDGCYGCGHHHTKFDKQRAQANFRAELNPFLKDYGEGFTLTADGEIQHLGPHGLTDLVSAAVQRSRGQPDGDRIAHAVRKFMRGTATRDDRLDALRVLAAVHENTKPKILAALEKEGAAPLYNIANNYTVRHVKPGQLDIPDRMMAWVFHIFLAGAYVGLDLDSVPQEDGESANDDIPF